MLQIDAFVVKVTDGDTYRVRHITKGHASPVFEGKLSENTIVVRIAAVDTPETAKFGQQGQKLGSVATEFVKNKLLQKKVRVKLLSKDQYGRVVGLVKYNEPKTGFFSAIFGGCEDDGSHSLSLTLPPPSHSLPLSLFLSLPLPSLLHGLIEIKVNHISIQRRRGEGHL